MQAWLLHGSWVPLPLRLPYGVEERGAAQPSTWALRSSSLPAAAPLAKLRLCRGALPLGLRPDISGKKRRPILHSCCRCGAVCPLAPAGPCPTKCSKLALAQERQGDRSWGARRMRGPGITASMQSLHVAPLLQGLGTPKGRTYLLPP